MFLNWCTTQFLTVMFLPMTSWIVTCMMNDTWRERTAFYIPLKDVQVGVKRWSRWKGVPKNKTKMKVLRVTMLLQNISPGNSTWRKQMNATTPGFISSLMIKVVIDETSSLLRQDSSEQHPPLDCMCDQNDSQRLPTFEFPPCRSWFKLRLWCMNWLWHVSRIVGHLNKQICNKKDLLCSVAYSVLASKRTETSIWLARSFASTFQKPAHGCLRR
jgi:hypothetical protein